MTHRDAILQALDDLASGRIAAQLPLEGLDAEELALTLHLNKVIASLGTFDRSHFMDAAANEVARARRHRRRFSLMLMDIDPEGRLDDDRRLQAMHSVVQACASLLRTTDLFGRIPGEALAIALPETTAESAATLASRLREGLAEGAPGSAPPRDRVSLSIGVAEMSMDDEGLDDILRRADEALQEARRGEGQHVVVKA
jgi:diguanylate cyclase